MVHLYLDRLDAAVRAPSSLFFRPFHPYVALSLNCFTFEKVFFSILPHQLLGIADEMPDCWLGEHIEVQFA